jgi:hypothetical protein
MTLLLYLLISRMTSASGGDSWVATTLAVAGVRPAAHTAAEAAAKLVPERAEESLDLGIGGPRHEMQRLLTTGCRKAAAKFDRLAVDRRPDLFAPVAAGFAAEAEAIVDAQAIARRFGNHPDRSVCRICQQRQPDARQVDQQRVGTGIVRAQRLAVESTRIVVGDGKGAAVKYHVAPDLADTAQTNLPQQQPELLEAEPGIAAAAQVQVALQPAVAGRSLGECLGAPGVGRSQQLEAGIGRQQLHRRRRVERLARVVREQRRPAVDPLHDDADRAGGDSRLLECAADGGRQFCGSHRGYPAGQQEPACGADHDPARSAGVDGDRRSAAGAASCRLIGSGSGPAVGNPVSHAPKVPGG